MESRRRAIALIDSSLVNADPEDEDLLILKANILQSVRKFKQADRIYRSVLRRSPDNTLALIDWADRLSSSRSGMRSALRYYDKALVLIERGKHRLSAEQELVDGSAGKTRVLLRLGRPLDALRAAIRGLQHVPTDPILWDLSEAAREEYRRRARSRDQARRKRRS